MEKQLALAIVILIVAFTAVYAIVASFKEQSSTGRASRRR